VLYVVWHFPKISETYVAAELAYMTRQGVDVAVCTRRVGTPGMESPFKILRTSFREAMGVFKPDLIQVHYLYVGHAEILEAGGAALPVTVRGHSFDYNDDAVRKLLGWPHVRRIYLFPHMAARFPGEPRIMPVPVGFDSSRYHPHEAKDRSLVLRAATAQPTKGIEDFLRISALCPRHRFVLVANRVDEKWLPTLRKMVRTIGRVSLYEDLPNDEAARWTHEAGIYLDTSDARGHTFGMPISIAESMATGSVAFVRGSQAAADYVGNGATVYGSIEEAAAMIRETSTWTSSMWEDSSKRAVARAEVFKDYHSLAPILEDWRGLCRSRSQ
jgi:hypothetical protein